MRSCALYLCNSPLSPPLLPCCSGWGVGRLSFFLLGSPILWSLNSQLLSFSVHRCIFPPRTFLTVARKILLKKITVILLAYMYLGAYCVPGTIPSASLVLTCLLLKSVLYYPLLQVRKQRPREVQSVVSGHRPRRPVSRVYTLHHLHHNNKNHILSFPGISMLRILSLFIH